MVLLNSGKYTGIKCAQEKRLTAADVLILLQQSEGAAPDHSRAEHPKDAPARQATLHPEIFIIVYNTSSLSQHGR